MQNGAGAVLIVDQDIPLARSLSASLTEFGWSVELTHDTQEALSRLQSRSFDALVIDVESSESGLIERWEDATSRPLTILLSRRLDQSSTVRAVCLGAYDVLEKPVVFTEIDERLRMGLRQRRVDGASEPEASARILGETAPVRGIRERVRHLARFPDLSVMIVGEPGTGKQLAAEAIHALSGSREPFVTVACAAIPEHLLEAELFGCETDGQGETFRAQGVGLLELAGAGTVFFDEIADIPVQLQQRLQRAVERRVFRRVGGTEDREFRARIVSANNPRVTHEVPSELYYLLSGFTILCHPLRERVADVPLLAGHFLDQFAEHYPGAPSSLSPRAVEALRAYEWPANVRELRAVVQRAAVLAEGPVIGFDEVSRVIRELRAETELRASPTSASNLKLESVQVNEPLRVLERRVIEGAWQTSGKNLSAAARKLGLPRTTLRDRLRKYGLR